MPVSPKAFIVSFSRNNNPTSRTMTGRWPGSWLTYGPTLLFTVTPPPLRPPLTRCPPGRTGRTWTSTTSSWTWIPPWELTISSPGRTQTPMSLENKFEYIYYLSILRKEDKWKFFCDLCHQEVWQRGQAFIMESRQKTCKTGARGKYPVLFATRNFAPSLTL